MNIFDVISLLGGLAMFLYGMRLMGDSLKANSSGALRDAMAKVTNSPLYAFLLGVFVTAVIQSSTATIVITSGLVGAGILSLRQSLGIIVGANVGTTVTGQIIRLLDVNAGGNSVLRFFQPSTLAPLALILGMLLMMTNVVKNSKSIGNIAIGFGILFSGLLNMTGTVNSLAGSELVIKLFSNLGSNPLIGYLTGAGVAFVLQSSSATIGILQAFSSTGMLQFKAIYAVIVGVYLGDCVTTAIVCSIGAQPDAKRVGIVNILYNLSKSVIVLVGVTLAHSFGLLDRIWDVTVNSGIIANTNTIFNLGCAVILLPFVGIYEKLSHVIVKDEKQPEFRYKAELDGLSPVFFSSPALALQSIYNVLISCLEASRASIEKSFELLAHYDEKVFNEILEEEDNIDLMTDRVSKYIVELLPHIKLDYMMPIVDQYYKVASEFESLHDHALIIAKQAKKISEQDEAPSITSLSELAVLEEATDNILDETDATFRRRDVEAAARIEPLVQVINDLASQIKKNHLKRLGSGECSVESDAIFTDLIAEFRRIASICSNVGVATAVRVDPSLADHEHLYFENIRKGNDEKFRREYQIAHNRYFALLKKDEM